MTTYKINLFGRTYRYDLAPLDIINNVCESLAGEYENMLMDGMIVKAGYEALLKKEGITPHEYETKPLEGVDE